MDRTMSVYSLSNVLHTCEKSYMCKNLVRKETKFVFILNCFFFLGKGGGGGGMKMYRHCYFGFTFTFFFFFLFCQKLSLSLSMAASILQV